MTEFKIGDRVRVRNLPTTGTHAGMTGEVVWVPCNPVCGLAVVYNVRLDGHPAPAARFRPDELGPEAGGTP